MTRFAVIFRPQARIEALKLRAYIARSAPENAGRWYDGLERAIEALAEMPGRCGIARESKGNDLTLRQFIYHSHRIIFRVEEATHTVRILHVRHAAMKPLHSIDDES